MFRKQTFFILTLFALFAITLSTKGQTNLPVKISSDRQSHWYYITSAAQKISYCNGKVISGSSKAKGAPLTYAAIADDPSMLWRFIKVGANEYAIQNYATKRYIAADVNEGTSEQPAGYSIKPLAIDGQYNIAFGNSRPIHAQQHNARITVWDGAENTASAWSFVEVDLSTKTDKAHITAIACNNYWTVTAKGERKLPILIADVKVGGFVGEAELTGISVQIPAGYDYQTIEKVYIYASGNPNRFDITTADLIGSFMPKATQEMILFRDPLSLSLGSNYLWIVVDVAPSTKEGDQIKIELNSYVAKRNGKVTEIPTQNIHPTTVFLTKSVLFSPGDYGSKYYRIPAVETANDGSIVTVTDRRPFHEGDLPQAIDLYVRRSTDNGRTWSEPLMIAGAADDKNGFGDAAIVKTKSGKLVVLYVGYKGLWDSKKEDPQRQFIVTSDDNGITWSKPVELTHFFYGPTSQVKETKKWEAFFITSGRGLCTDNGTILFAIPTRVEGKKGLSVYTIGSSDEGKTWRVMDLAQPATETGDESKITQLSDGRLMMSVRQRGKRNIVYGRLKNNQIVWEKPIRHEDLTDPFCNGEIMVYTSKQDGYDKNRMLHALCDASNRSNVSVLLSYDEGKTYPVKRSICPTPSAYSTLNILPNGTIGCYYEDVKSEGMDLVYVTFSLDWLTKGKDTFRPSNKRSTK